VDVEEEEDDEVEEEDRSQDREAHFVRACTVEMHTDMSEERKFTGKMPGASPAASVLCEPAQSKCTWTVTRGILCGNLQGKCRTRIPRPAFRASLRSRNSHGHVRRSILCGNLQGNVGHFSRGQRFARACAVEMNMDMSQEAFCAEIYRENAKRIRYHLDWTPGLNTYRKNPSVWPHCLGKNT